MIDHNIILEKGTINEVLFRGRNKAYGAYHLRLVYPDHLKKSILYVLFSGATVVSTLIFLNSIQNKIPVEDIIFDQETVLTDYNPTPVEPAKSQPVSKAPIDPSKVIPDIVKDLPPTLENMKEPVKSPTTTGSETGNSLSSANSHQEGEGAGNSIIPNLSIVPNSGEVHEFPEEMPSFPGGEEALIRYIQNHTKFTKIAVDNEEEGTVIIEFVVNEDGNIDQITPIQKLQFGLTENAIEVVKRMPKWTPGKMNGQNVKVRYAIPISFRLD